MTPSPPSSDTATTSRLVQAIVTLAALVTIALSAAAAGVARDRDPNGAPSHTPLGANYPDEQRAKADRSKIAKRKAQRESDEGKSERRRSRTAYRGASRSEAVAIARAKFEDLIEAPVWRTADVGNGRGIERYLGDHAAQVDLGPGKEVGLVETTNPLRTLDADGRKVPIDLTLEDRGGTLAPATPQVALSIDEQARDGIAFDQAGVTVRVADADASAQIVEDKAFFANALRDTDLVVMPTPGGAQAFFDVRSADSPEEATLDFDLPAGARLEGDGDGARIVRGGERIAEVESPLASDADGIQVPVSYRVAGDRLVVGFAHRDRDVRYPVMVDPNIVFAVKEVYGGGWPGAWPDYNGWVSSQSGPHWWNHAFIPGSGGGLDISGSFSPYDFNEWRQWGYEAPPNSYIYRAELQSSHNWYWDCIDEGLWAFQNNWNWQSLQQPGGCGGSYNHAWTTACSEASCSPTASYNYDRNFAVHSLRNAYAGGVVQPDTTWTRLEAANLYLKDSNKPRFTAFSGNHPSSGWVKSGTYFVDATTVDDGLGMYMVEMANNTGSGFSVEKKWHGCVGDVRSRCPATWGPPSGTSWSPRFTYYAEGQPEGVNWYSLTAWDAVANRSAEDKIWALAIDRTGPTIQDPTGSLWDRRNRTDDKRFQGLYDATYTMNVTAGGEGNNNSDRERRSGVKKIDIDVVNAQTGAVERSHPDVPQTCAASSCTKTRPFTFVSDDYSDGEKIIRIKAYDQVDNPSATKEFRVTVDRRGDVYRGTQSTAPDTEIIADEWAKLGTKVARREEAAYVKTRGPVQCGSSTCHEVRTVSRKNGYTVYRGDGTDDPRLEQIAEILEPKDGDSAPSQGSGQLENALATWQVPPPAHGASYVYYEATEPVEEDGDPSYTITSKLWVDERTRMPLKGQYVDPSTGEVLGTLYWTYDVERKLESELPADHFTAGPPSGLSYEKNLAYVGTDALGVRLDAETGATFRPFDLGNQASVADRGLCLATASTVSDNDRAARDIPAPAPTDPPSEVDGSTRDLSKFTTAESYYNPLAAGVTCVPGLGDLESPSIEVVSMASMSSQAAELREAYMVDGSATPLDAVPLGISPGITPSPTVAFVVPEPAEEPGTSAFIDLLPDTSVVITGAYDDSELNEIIAQLRPR